MIDELLRTLNDIQDKKKTDMNINKDEIEFNGSPISDVISYDEAAGEVHYYEKHWSSGDYVPDGTDPTGYRTARAKGKVEVVKKYVPPAPSPNLNYDPCGQCGIETGTTPWYPYRSPGFYETVQKLEFEFQGFDSIGLKYPNGVPGFAQGCILGQLTVDGTVLKGHWTLTDVTEQANCLELCFVALILPHQFGLSALCLSACELDNMGLRGQAYTPPGHPHIYKIVRLQTPSCLRPIDPDAKDWLLGSKVCLKALGLSSFADPVLQVLRTLC